MAKFVIHVFAKAEKHAVSEFAAKEQCKETGHDFGSVQDQNFLLEHGLGATGMIVCIRCGEMKFANEGRMTA